MTRDVFPVLAGGVLCISCSATLHGAAERPHGPCDSFDTEQGRVWNTTERARVRSRMSNVGPSYAARAAHDAGDRIDAVARDWVEGRRAVCIAANGQKGTSPGASCYAEALTVERAAIEGLAASDRATLPSALDVVRVAQNAIERCRHPAALVAFAGAPDDATTGPKSANARLALARAVVRLAQGDRTTARREAGIAEKLGRENGATTSLAAARVVRARAWVRDGHLPEARLDLEDAETAFTQTTDPTGLAEALAAKSEVAARAKDFAEALRQAERSRSLFEQALGSGNYQTLDAELWVAESERANGAVDQAVERYVRAIRTAEQGPDKDPWWLARAHRELGHLYGALGAGREAEREQRLRLELLAQLLGPDHPACADAHQELGALLADRGQLADGLAEAARAFAIRVSAFGDVSLPVAESGVLIGNLRSSLGNQEGALDAYTRALGIRVQLLGADHPEVGETHQFLGRTLQALGRYDEAIAELQRALTIEEDENRRATPELAAVHDQIGVVLRAAKRYDDALFEHHLAVEALKESLGPDAAAVAAEQGRIASILEEQGKLDDAVDTYREVLRLDEGALGKDHPTAGNDHSSLGRVLGLEKQFPESVSELKQALAIHEHALGKDHPDVALDRRQLGLTLVAMGRMKDALPELVTALAFYEKAIPVDEAAVRELRTALAKLGKRTE